MYRIRLFALSVCLCIFGTAVAAPPHSISYSKKPRNPGTIISVGGEDFVIVRVPVADFSGNRYSITFPAEIIEGQLSFGGLTTTHTVDPIQTNATIDGFPAFINVIDQRTYALAGDFVQPGTNTFLVTAQATATVSIQIGSMVVTLGGSFETDDPNTGLPPETNVNIGSSFNAVSNAEWYKRIDLTAKVIFLDQLIDYVTIFPWQ